MSADPQNEPESLPARSDVSSEPGDLAVLPAEPHVSGVMSGEKVAFTGILASMTHRQAREVVEQRGGSSSEHVSRQTTLLVVGEEGWPLEADGRPSVKLLQAIRWQQEGLPLRVIKESDWLTAVDLSHRRDGVQRRYTPAMLSQLLQIPVSQIRAWERWGLIRAVEHVYRLPYFDYQEVASARRLADLLAAGVSPREVAESLQRISHLLPNAERPLAQLEILAQQRGVVYRDDRGQLWDRFGQRRFDFDQTGDEETAPGESPPSIAFPGETDPAGRTARPRSAEQLFDAGRTRSEAGDLSGAEQLYRESLSLRPGEPDVQLHLAEVLYRSGRVEAACERLCCLLESDPQHLEAWIQRGCLEQELAREQAARHAWQTALAIHADCAEAHYHLGELEFRCGELHQAQVHWLAYLELEQRGPWADLARDRLGLAAETDHAEEELPQDDLQRDELPH